MTARFASRLTAAALGCVCAAAVGARPPASGALEPSMARPQSGVPARSPGKPTAPMTVEFALGGEPAVGALLEISIDVRAAAEVDDLALDVRADDGQALLVAALAPVAGRRGAWVLTVVPLTDATSYLNVTAQGTIGGATQTRSVAIPVRPSAAKPAAQAVRASAAAEGAGERVVLLPAAETLGPAAK